jgi:4'-phosphopantetheinyl transferase superfamily
VRFARFHQRCGKAFFNFWTLKEDYVKASGEGVLLPFDKFDVTTIGGDAPTFVRSGICDEEFSWSLVKLDLGYPYILRLWPRREMDGQSDAGGGQSKHTSF